MALSEQRAFVTPEPGDDWNVLASRVLPGEPAEMRCAAEEDVLRSYRLHANAYVPKPVDFEQFIKVIRQIDDFFVTVVRLPKG